MESWRYEDPARVVETLQRQERRALKGCASCRFRGERVLGKHICGIGNKPGPRGFCPEYRERDDE